MTPLYCCRTRQAADLCQADIETADATKSTFFLREELGLVPSATAPDTSWSRVHLLIGFRDDLASKANSATYGLRPGTAAHQRAMEHVDAEIVCSDDLVAPRVTIAATSQQFIRPRWSLRTTRAIECRPDGPTEILLDYGDKFFDDDHIQPMQHHEQMYECHVY